jgi:hypothetical protein
MKILLGDFNAKVGREDIFKPTIGSENLHEISNDNGVRVVNFATSKNLTVKSTMFSLVTLFYLYKFIYCNIPHLSYQAYGKAYCMRAQVSEKLFI